MEDNEERGLADPPNEMMESAEATPEQLPQNNPEADSDPLPEDVGSVALPDVGQGESPEALPPLM